MNFWWYLNYTNVEASRLFKCQFLLSFQGSRAHFHVRSLSKLIINYLDCGVSQGIFTKIDNYREDIFRIWGMIAGLIIIANSKEDYLKGAICFEKYIFLENSYKKIYETLLSPT